jgi:hypothetical protein
MSNTLARRLLEDRSFNSSSRICRVFRDESGSLPGRLIRSMQGSQCKKIVLIWNQIWGFSLTKRALHLSEAFNMFVYPGHPLKVKALSLHLPSSKNKK